MTDLFAATWAGRPRRGFPRIAGTRGAASLPRIFKSVAALLIICPARLWAASIDFEPAEGFATGSGIESHAGWAATQPAGGIITDETSSGGGQSLKIPASEPPAEIGYEGEGLPQSGVRFIALSVKPVADDPSTAEIALNLWGSEIGFVRGTDGSVQVVAMAWDLPPKVIGTTIQTGPDGQADHWLRLVVRQDLDARTWDLAVDGKLAAINLPWNGNEAESMAIFGSGSADTFLDELSVGPANPLFPDADSDFLPDAYEIAHRLNPHADDRAGDLDLDGVTNLAEALAGARPDVAGDTAGNRILYVNNLTGNDSHSGSTSHAVGADGPKASIKAAMTAAHSGDVIVVLRGTGVYNEGSRGTPGKALTIKTVEPVVIK